MILFVKYAESRVANEKKNETVSIQPNRKIKTIVDMIFPIPTKLSKHSQKSKRL